MRECEGEKELRGTERGEYRRRESNEGCERRKKD